MAEKEKKQFKKEHTEQGVRFIWIVGKNSFIQRPVLIGINDETCWEVLSGLQESELLITDIQEPNVMEKVYGEWFQGAL